MTSQMNVLILFSGAFPGPSAGAKRIQYYKNGLINAGVNADIFPVTQIYSGRISFYISSLLLPFKVACFFLKKRKKYEILFLYGFGWFSYFLLSIIARFSSVKLYLELNEKQGTVYGTRFTELRIVRLVSLYMTRMVYNVFDGFVVISDALKEDMEHYVLRGAKIIKIPIISDHERNAGSIKKPDANMPYIFHSGALSDRKDGMAEVFAAFAKACKSLDRRIHFYLTSKLAPADLLQKIERVIKENTLENNIHFLGDITEDLLLSYQKYCSLVIINKHLNEQNLHNFPTKLGEYLALGIPVITTGIGEMGNYLEDGVNAFIVPVNNIDALAEKIIYVIQHPDESLRVAENGKKTASVHFNYLDQGRRLADFFKL